MVYCNMISMNYKCYKKLWLATVVVALVATILAAEMVVVATILVAIQW